MTKEEFINLYTINVNSKVDKKNGLSYLSWSFARAEFKKQFPNATYEIKLFDNKPYIYDENLGYMVFTSVTVGDLTHEMWLPVMDGANKAMKDKEYTYKVKDKTGKYVERLVQPATMFDINKTIMRCLTKNLAMFGLGLYIYNGEDLPEEEGKDIKEENVTMPRITEEQIVSLKDKGERIKGFKNSSEMIAKIREKYKVGKDKAKALESLYFLITGKDEGTTDGANDTTNDTKAGELQE